MNWRLKVADELVDERYEKFRRIGVFLEETQAERVNLAVNCVEHAGNRGISWTFAKQVSRLKSCQYCCASR